MIVKIQTRNDKGKYVKACALDFAEAAFSNIVSIGPDGGWRWISGQLQGFCIRMARENCKTPQTADRWYARYQAIRGIE